MEEEKTQLEINIDTALAIGNRISGYADTILGNTTLDENEGVNIALDIDENSTMSVENNILIIE